jgi:hypothetical protein
MASTLPRKPPQGSPLAANQPVLTRDVHWHWASSLALPLSQRPLWARTSLPNPRRKGPVAGCFERKKEACLTFVYAWETLPNHGVSEEGEASENFYLSPSIYRSSHPVNTGCPKRQDNRGNTLFSVPFPL